MAFFDEEFDLNDLPEASTGGFEPLPAGWYSAVVKNVEIKTTKMGNGRYLAIRYDIMGPTHQGRVVFGNLNINNPNPKAEEIGRQQLGDLMRSIGIAKLTNSDQLIGGNVMIKLSITKSEQYGDSNDIKAFKPVNGAVSAPIGMTSAAKPAATKAAPPWARK